MSEAARKVIELAMSLSDEERLQVAGELVESVRAASDPEWEAAWLEELDRRLAELRSGEVTAIPWSEAREKLRASLP